MYLNEVFISVVNKSLNFCKGSVVCEWSGISTVSSRTVDRGLLGVPSILVPDLALMVVWRSLYCVLSQWLCLCYL